MKSTSPSPLFRSALRTLPLLAVAGCASGPEGPAPVTPQRPTVSSNTSTTHPGTFELEAGVAIDNGDFFDTPLTLKYGAGEDTELFAAWSPYQRIALPGPNGDGIGDLGFGARHRFLEETEETPAAAVQLFTSLPTADEGEGLGSGEIDFFAAGILDKGFGDVSGTVFYQIGVLGEPAGDDADIEHTLALAAGVPIDEIWGVFGEASTILVPERDLEVFQLIGGATYTLQPDLVFDAALLLGLSEDAPDFQILFGLTHNFGGPAGQRTRR